VLATEIAAQHDESAAALPAYEAWVRGYVERNQALAYPRGRLVSPATPLHLHSRNALLRALPLFSRLGVGPGAADHGPRPPAPERPVGARWPTGIEPRPRGLLVAKTL